MWQIAVPILMLVVSAPGEAATVDAVTFGPRQTLTCTWFTNFETSRFDQCQGAGGDLLPPGEGASIKCRERTCDELNAAARTAAYWREQEPLWGTFTVRFVGRLSLQQHQRRYLGDGTHTVLVEKLLSVRKLP